MRQVLGPGALGRPRGIGWRGRWEGGLGWGTHVNPWLIHVNVWQEPLQYCKVISLQLIKINGKKKADLNSLAKKKEKMPKFLNFNCLIYFFSISVQPLGDPREKGTEYMTGFCCDSTVVICILTEVRKILWDTHGLNLIPNHLRGPFDLSWEFFKATELSQLSEQIPHSLLYTWMLAEQIVPQDLNLYFNYS